MHVHLSADLLGQLRGNIEGPGLPLDEQGDLKLTMQIFAVRTVAIWLSALAPPFDETSGEHFTECTEAANQSATGLEFFVTGHGWGLPPPDTKHNVRKARKSSSFGICKNDQHRRQEGDGCTLNRLAHTV
jgi:hypothetical protein